MLKKKICFIKIILSLLLILTVSSCNLFFKKPQLSFKKKITRNLASSGAALSCKSLFKAHRLVLAKNIIIDHLKHPRKLILKDSLRQEQAHLPKINWKRHPFKFINSKAFIEPTRYLTRRFLKNEYEPSFLLSFAVSMFLFIEAMAPLEESNTKLHKEHDANIQLKHDYRYKSFKQAEKILKDLQKKKKLSEKDRKIIVQLQQVLLKIPHINQSYDLYFYSLLSYQKDINSSQSFTPQQALIDINTHKKFSKNKKLMPSPAEWIQAMIEHHPYLFLDWAKHAQSTPESKFPDLEQIKLTKTFNQQEYLVTLLFKIFQKNLQQEIIYRHLYKSSHYYNMAVNFIEKNTSINLGYIKIETDFDQLKQAFPEEVKKLLNSSLYKKIQSLLQEGKVSKGDALHSMQEFVQWQFNFSIWHNLGFQKVITYKKQGKNIKLPITIDLVERDLIKSLL